MFSDAEQIGRKRRKRIPNFSEMFDVKGSAGVTLPSVVSPFVSLSGLSGFTLVPSSQQQQGADVTSQTQRPVAKPRRSKQQQQQNGQTAIEAMDVSAQTQAAIAASQSQPSVAASDILSQMMEPDPEDFNERSFPQLSSHAQEQMIQVISAALRNFAATNDSRFLMTPHRQLIGGQDDHGDT